MGTLTDSKEILADIGAITLASDDTPTKNALPLANQRLARANFIGVTVILEG